MEPAATERIVVDGRAVRVRVARRLFERMRGLIGTPEPGEGEGIVIENCNAIHTFFMRYPIDATFLDAAGRPVKTVKDIRPWRLFVWGGWKARKVLETASRARPEGRNRLSPTACAAGRGLRK